ncbi:NAD(P)-dependent oxidoreductase [Mesorhizobium xinjiangense]|uniref:NAD(P)-dependent oxidoreductase n=1 Tax=Mesorhizobium xinjiangense TaxID=2678685 RepID=UPI0012ED7154|nr:hydroxyacid dehydrogenase [Mesorhizobium xinjiangense]
MTDIFSTHNLHPEAVEILKGLGRLRFASAPDPDTLLKEGRDADILIVRAPLPPALFDGPTKLRAAIRHGAGLDMVPMDAANRAGVLVANTPGVNAATVAEYVFFAAMALLRRFRMVERDLRTEGWTTARRQTDHARDLGDLTLGVVGFGNIGQRVCEIGRQGFGLDVLVHSRSRREAPAGTRFVELDEIAAEADILVLCCPLAEETRGLVNASLLARMKPDAIIINIARGAVIDDAAMIAALRDGRIGGAALDVFAQQPLPADHPYLTFDNVIVTPHMAGITEGSMRRMGVGAAEEAERVLSGRLPLNFCNPEVLDAYLERFPDTET